MKNCVIFFDCHAGQMFNYIRQNRNFRENFNLPHIISIMDYTNKNGKYGNNKKLAEEHINKIKKSDIFIIQVIEKDRGFLNNSEVIKYCNSNCKIIKIPHYRNSIYEYKCIENVSNKQDLLWYDNTSKKKINIKWNLPNKIKDLNNIAETKKIIQNEIDIMNNFKYDEDDMFKSINDKIKEFEKIDSLSDIKMLDYFNNNFKKYRLFQGRRYPSSRFFFELTNRILQRLKISPNKIYVDSYFALNTGEPIPNYWYKYCKFTFDKKYYRCAGNIDITEIEWYYILLLSQNPNIKTGSENLRFLKKIRGL